VSYNDLDLPGSPHIFVPGESVANARRDPMTGSSAITSDHIGQAVKTLTNTRPIYSEMLSFYAKIFMVQEDAKSQIHLEPIHIPAEVLAVKTRQKLPLVNMNDFVVDIEAGHVLIKKICKILQSATEEMAAGAETLFNAVGDSIQPADLFSNLLAADDDFFDKTATALTMDKKTLAFITYSSIKPSVTLCAEQLSTYLDKDLHAEKGYCPICGNLPGLSTLRDEGQRFLHCSFCWHEWVSKRVYCPFCNNTDSKSLHYFFSEEEKDYRIYVCDSCKKYLKTVDARKADRWLYPPLEQIASLHLDIKAQEMGFESGMQLDLPV
jgi:FdhE protein